MHEQPMTELSNQELIDLLADPDGTTMQAAQATLLNRGASTLEDLINGLTYHKSSRVRAICALLMDHLGDDRCYLPLCAALKNDRIESVRRCALHGLACQNCKECPLTGDLIAPILDAALHDKSIAVRRCALQYLVGQRPDERAITAARQIRRTSADPRMLQRAERVITWHTAS